MPVQPNDRQHLFIQPNYKGGGMYLYCPMIDICLYNLMIDKICLYSLMLEYISLYSLMLAVIVVHAVVAGRHM